MVLVTSDILCTEVLLHRMPKAKAKRGYPPIARVTRRSASAARNAGAAAVTRPDEAGTAVATSGSVQNIDSIQNTNPNEIALIRHSLDELTKTMASLKSQLEIVQNKTDNVVTQKVVEDHINNLTGEDTESLPPLSFNSVRRPVDYHISDKLKSKIWANEFVDMGQMLESGQNSEFSVIATTSSEFKIIQKDTPKKIHNIHQWSSAFMTYLAIYCKKNPDSVSSLVHYNNRIRSLASKGGDWMKYDTGFRKMRERELTDWANTDWELWFECLTSSPSFKYNANRAQPPFPNSFRRKQIDRKKHPNGYCFRFHETNQCSRSGCPFKHTCYKCEGAHPVSKCSTQKPTPGNSKQYSDKKQ